jgi:AcrR family transcriptional regulator
MKQKSEEKTGMTRKEAVIRAATELFARRGYSATPTSKIAQAAGVAEGTIFHHFKTKEGILVYLVTVKRSLERVGVAERFEGLAQTTLSQEMERLKEGLSDTFRILDFQDDVIGAHIRKTSALVDFNQGLANLFRAMGNNLERFDIVAAMPEKETIHAE